MSLLSQFFGGGSPSSPTPGLDSNGIPVETLIVGGGGGSAGSIIFDGTYRDNFDSSILNVNGSGVGGGGAVFFGTMFIQPGTTCPVIVGAGGAGGALTPLDCNLEALNALGGDFDSPSQPFANAPYSVQRSRLDYFKNILNAANGANGGPSSFNGFEVLGGGGGGTFSSAGNESGTGGGSCYSYSRYFDNIVGGLSSTQRIQQQHLVVPQSKINRFFLSSINFLDSLAKYIYVTFDVTGSSNYGISTSNGIAGTMTITGTVNPALGTLNATGSFGSNDSGLGSYVVNNIVETSNITGKLYGNPAGGFEFNLPGGSNHTVNTSYNNLLFGSLTYMREEYAYTQGATRLGGGGSNVIHQLEIAPASSPTNTKISSIYHTSEPAILLGFEGTEKDSPSYGTRYAGSFLNLGTDPIFSYLDYNMRGAAVGPQFGYHTDRENYNAFIDPASGPLSPEYVTSGTAGNAGVIIIRYPDAYASVAAPARPGSTDLSPQTPGYRTYKFENSGSIILP